MHTLRDTHTQTSALKQQQKTEQDSTSQHAAHIIIIAFDLFYRHNLVYVCWKRENRTKRRLNAWELCVCVQSERDDVHNLISHTLILYSHVWYANISSTNKNCIKLQPFNKIRERDGELNARQKAVKKSSGIEIHSNENMARMK